MRPNRSLTPGGRQQWFLLFAGTTILCAGAATAIGAWMVLPFAGFEILFLWCAFHLIGRHDGDYEWLKVVNREFYWSRCECGQVEMLSGNAEWVHLFAIARNGRVEVGLRYRVYKTVYVELTQKFAYGALKNVPVYKGTADHNLWMSEQVFSAGFLF